MELKPTSDRRSTMRQVTPEQAVDFLAEISGVPDISPRTRFGELCLDSLGVIQWITNLEEHLDVDLDVRKIDFRQLDDHSVAAVLDIIHRHAAETDQRAD
jgi:acyl carrier protein